MTIVEPISTADLGATGSDVRRRWQIDIPEVSAADLFPVKWQLYLSIVGLGVGVLQGLVQALERVNVDLYSHLPLSESYYQGLTLHGVALAFVFTFCFANAFLPLTTMRGFRRPMASRAIANGSLYCAWAGTVMAVWAILANEATVMFTFYSPLKATTWFYLGAVLLVVSTWLTLLNQLLTMRQWRRAGNRDERIPLLAFTSIATSIMWTLASVGVAVEVVVFLIPWSLGWIDQVDPQFNRLLFWFTGHPIVYFWLLPVYVSWYLMLPRQAGGGRIYSDGLTRLAFIAFVVLLPVGVHHQFTDPGISVANKGVQWLITWTLFFPSLLTLFSVVAALEQAGRRRGGKGILGWIWKLPWSNPSVSAQLLGGLAFMLGGMSGLINSSYTLNLEVHNTSFIVGHFHLTVGTAVALSIMGMCYWLVPYLTGKALFARKLAVAQTFLWAGGVALFSRGQMMGGLEGMPRRTQISDAVYLDDHPGWDLANQLTGIGGSIMFVAGILFLVVIIGTLVHNKEVQEPQVIPVVSVVHGAREGWRILDRLGTWALVATVLTVLVYGHAILHYLPLNSVSNPIRVW